MHRWWAFTPPVWCEFGGFSRYNFYSAENRSTLIDIEAGMTESPPCRSPGMDPSLYFRYAAATDP